MTSYLDKIASLTPLARQIIEDKATEYPHSGCYNQLTDKGTYLCRRCGLALFRGVNQFHAGCGWPSFDSIIPEHVKRQPDLDGQRMEIVCRRCAGHLGHVFTGEFLTAKNCRHCVNSASIDWVKNNTVMDTEEAIIAGGCFWGIDYYLNRLPGVLKVEVGYTGGDLKDPTYTQVCQGNTGHYEAARIVYDKEKTTYRAVIKHFFEIHDPTQADGQGPDHGSQYRSAIFYYNMMQKQDAEELIQLLTGRNYQVVTALLPVTTFWPAEAYHQHYYEHHQKMPYCHHPVPRFG